MSKLTKAEAAKILEEIMHRFSKHATHNKKQVGPCVYCIDCNERLYQGKL
jgi:hypothetical protein